MITIGANTHFFLKIHTVNARKNKIGCRSFETRYFLVIMLLSNLNIPEYALEAMHFQEREAGKKGKWIDKCFFNPIFQLRV